VIRHASSAEHSPTAAETTKPTVFTSAATTAAATTTTTSLFQPRPKTDRLADAHIH
jgi:hypothetical protein